ncbi:MAG: helix-turn-helix domain-containing protein [Bacteroidota bacterium]|nr:helix-turn-helix domain-containing protein [Bacteroidota bacterium]
MIQQPELGKKIADCRKAKGLTQEELAAKCNLDVRTLQRIESAKVVPRTYNVKLIFEALEISYDNSLNSSDMRFKEVFLRKLEQFKIWFIDLFNLKTNTMKKISILTAMIAVVVLGVFAVSSKVKANNAENNDQVITSAESFSDSDLRFYNFSCHGCMEKKGLIIGRDISFTLVGVKVKNIRLIAIDKETREFDALFVEGKFLERKVTVKYPKEWLVDGSLRYSADMIDETDSEIILRGNAKVYDLNDIESPDDDESIETDEIIITLID